MKKKASVLLVMLPVLLGLLAMLVSCQPVETPPVTGGEAPAAITKVASKWSGGDLYFTKKSTGATILKLDGTNGDVEITTATISGGTASSFTLTSPTISGTAVVANRDSGISDNLTAGSGAGVVVNHGLGSTPTRIWLSWAADPGGDQTLYPSSVNSTSFTINPSDNVTNGVQVYWLAMIADE